MDYKIVLHKAWRYRHRKCGYITIDPGTYLVPEQIDASAAELAVAQGMATKHIVQMPTVPKVDAESDVPASAGVAVQAELTRRGRRRRRSKGPAPENKIAHAPENKTSLV